MITKSLFLLSSVILTVFCLCCKDEEVPIFEPTSCAGALEFLLEPPPPGRDFEPASLTIADDCLLTFLSTTFCTQEEVSTNLFVVATPDSLLQLFLRVSPDSTCTNLVSINGEFDLVTLRSAEADSVVLVFPEADTSLVYSY